VESLRKSLEEVRAVAELPKFKFHALRHYYISQCVMAGVDLLTIASRESMGTSTTNINKQRRSVWTSK
jgi:hypothetical protein